MIHVLGEQSWDVGQLVCVCQLDPFMHVHAEHHDQVAQGEVDSCAVCLLLLHVHSRTVLP